MHATFMPTVVFPDTFRGHNDARDWETSAITVKYFCPHYGGSNDGLCRNRNPLGEASRCLCNRCVYGFMFDVDRLGLVAK